MPKSQIKKPKTIQNSLPQAATGDIKFSSFTTMEAATISTNIQRMCPVALRSHVRILCQFYHFNSSSWRDAGRSEI